MPDDTIVTVTQNNYFRDEALQEQSHPGKRYLGSFWTGYDRTDLHYVRVAERDPKTKKCVMTGACQATVNGQLTKLHTPPTSRAQLTPSKIDRLITFLSGIFKFKIKFGEKGLEFQAAGLDGGMMGEGDVKVRDDTRFAQAVRVRSQTLPKLHIQPGTDINDLQNTQELALALRHTPTGHKMYGTYETRAYNFIKCFSEYSGKKTRAHYRQLSILAASKHQDISRKVLSLLLSDLEKNTLLDIELLIAIGDTFTASNAVDFAKPNETSVFTDDDRMKALGAIKFAWMTYHTKAKDHTQLLAFLQAFTKTLNGMADGHVKGIAYTEHDELYESIKAFEKNADEAVAAEATCALQALISIKSDKTQAEIHLMRLMAFVNGVDLLGSTVTSISLQPIQTAVGEFRKFAHSQDRPAIWHQHYRLLSALLRLKEWKIFSTFLVDAELKKMPEKHQFHLLQHLILFMGQIVANRKHEELLRETNTTSYNKSIEFLTSLFTGMKEWGALAGLSKDFLKFDKMTSIKKDILKELKISGQHPEKVIHEPARKALKTLRALPETVIPKEWFTEADIPEDIDGLLFDGSLKETVIAVDSSEIWALAKKEDIGVQSKINALMHHWTNTTRKDNGINKPLSTYIPSHGSRKIDGTNRFELEKEVFKLLEQPDKSPERAAQGKKALDVLLLLGGSASGKTLTAKHLTREYAKKYEAAKKLDPNNKSAPIPIYIPLETTMNHSSTTIDEFLKRYPNNFTDMEIQKFKDEKRRFVFIFDGYDELGEKFNLFSRYNLAEWNCQAIITCRSQYLIGRKGHEDMFAPKDSNKVALKDRLMGLYITKFDKDQIPEYLDQYIKKCDTAPCQNEEYAKEWDSFDKYMEQIKKIPGLIDIMCHPFFAFITAEILPKMIKKWNAKERTGSISTVYLLGGMMKEWNRRATGRITDAADDPRNAKAINDYPDLKKAITNHQKQIAAKMYAKDITSVKYERAAKGKPAHEWEEEFGDDARVLIEGDALQNDGANGWEFINPLVREFFVFLQIFDAIKDKEHVKDPRVIANFTEKLMESKSLKNMFAEGVQSNEAFKTVLMEFAKKSDPASAIAAKNSQEILELAAKSQEKGDYKIAEEDEEPEWLV